MELLVALTSEKISVRKKARAEALRFWSSENEVSLREHFLSYRNTHQSRRHHQNVSLARRSISTGLSSGIHMEDAFSPNSDEWTETRGAGGSHLHTVDPMEDTYSDESDENESIVWGVEEDTTALIKTYSNLVEMDLVEDENVMDDLLVESKDSRITIARVGMMPLGLARRWVNALLTHEESEAEYQRSKCKPAEDSVITFVRSVLRQIMRFSKQLRARHIMPLLISLARRCSANCQDSFLSTDGGLGANGSVALYNTSYRACQLQILVDIYSEHSIVVSLPFQECTSIVLDSLSTLLVSRDSLKDIHVRRLLRIVMSTLNEDSFKHLDTLLQWQSSLLETVGTPEVTCLFAENIVSLLNTHGLQLLPQLCTHAAPLIRSCYKILSSESVLDTQFEAMLQLFWIIVRLLHNGETTECANRGKYATGIGGELVDETIISLPEVSALFRHAREAFFGDSFFLSAYKFLSQKRSANSHSSTGSQTVLQAPRDSLHIRMRDPWWLLVSDTVSRYLVFDEILREGANLIPRGSFSHSDSLNYQDKGLNLNSSVISVNDEDDMTYSDVGTVLKRPRLSTPLFTEDDGVNLTGGRLLVDKLTNIFLATNISTNTSVSRRMQHFELLIASAVHFTTYYRPRSDREISDWLNFSLRLLPVITELKNDPSLASQLLTLLECILLYVKRPLAGQQTDNLSQGRKAKLSNSYESLIRWFTVNLSSWDEFFHFESQSATMFVLADALFSLLSTLLTQFELYLATPVVLRSLAASIAKWPKVQLVSQLFSPSAVALSQSTSSQGHSINFTSSSVTPSTPSLNEDGEEIEQPLINLVTSWMDIVLGASRKKVFLHSESLYSLVTNLFDFAVSSVAIFPKDLSRKSRDDCILLPSQNDLLIMIKSHCLPSYGTVVLYNPPKIDLLNLDTLFNDKKGLLFDHYSEASIDKSLRGLSAKLLSFLGIDSTGSAAKITRQTISDDDIFLQATMTTVLNTIMSALQISKHAISDSPSISTWSSLQADLLYYSFTTRCVHWVKDMHWRGVLSRLCVIHGELFIRSSISMNDHIAQLHRSFNTLLITVRASRALAGLSSSQIALQFQSMVSMESALLSVICSYRAEEQLLSLPSFMNFEHLIGQWQLSPYFLSLALLSYAHASIFRRKYGVAARCILASRFWKHLGAEGYEFVLEIFHDALLPSINGTTSSFLTIFQDLGSYHRPDLIFSDIKPSKIRSSEPGTSSTNEMIELPTLLLKLLLIEESPLLVHLSTLSIRVRILRVRIACLLLNLLPSLQELRKYLPDLVLASLEMGEISVLAEIASGIGPLMRHFKRSSAVYSDLIRRANIVLDYESSSAKFTIQELLHIGLNVALIATVCSAPVPVISSQTSLLKDGIRDLMRLTSSRVLLPNQPTRPVLYRLLSASLKSISISRSFGGRDSQSVQSELTKYFLPQLLYEWMQAGLEMAAWQEATMTADQFGAFLERFPFEVWGGKSLRDFAKSHLTILLSSVALLASPPLLTAFSGLIMQWFVGNAANRQFPDAEMEKILSSLQGQSELLILREMVKLLAGSDAQYVTSTLPLPGETPALRTEARQALALRISLCDRLCASESLTLSLTRPISNSQNENYIQEPTRSNATPAERVSKLLSASMVAMSRLWYESHEVREGGRLYSFEDHYSLMLLLLSQQAGILGMSAEVYNSLRCTRTVLLACLQRLPLTDMTSESATILAMVEWLLEIPSEQPLVPGMINTFRKMDSTTNSASVSPLEKLSSNIYDTQFLWRLLYGVLLSSPRVAAGAVIKLYVRLTRTFIILVSSSKSRARVSAMIGMAELLFREISLLTQMLAGGLDTRQSSSVNEEEAAKEEASNAKQLRDIQFLRTYYSSPNISASELFNLLNEQLIGWTPPPLPFFNEELASPELIELSERPLRSTDELVTYLAGLAEMLKISISNSRATSEDLCTSGSSLLLCSHLVGTPLAHRLDIASQILSTITSFSQSGALSDSGKRLVNSQSYCVDSGPSALFCALSLVCDALYEIQQLQGSTSHFRGGDVEIEVFISLLWKISPSYFKCDQLPEWYGSLRYEILHLLTNNAQSRGGLDEEEWFSMGSRIERIRPSADDFIVELKCRLILRLFSFVSDTPSSTSCHSLINFRRVRFWALQQFLIPQTLTSETTLEGMSTQLSTSIIGRLLDSIKNIRTVSTRRRFDSFVIAFDSLSHIWHPDKNFVSTIEVIDLALNTPHLADCPAEIRAQLRLLPISVNPSFLLSKVWEVVNIVSQIRDCSYSTWISCLTFTLSQTVCKRLETIETLQLDLKLVEICGIISLTDENIAEAVFRLLLLLITDHDVLFNEDFTHWTTLLLKHFLVISGGLMPYHQATILAVRGLMEVLQCDIGSRIVQGDICTAIGHRGTVYGDNTANNRPTDDDLTEEAPFSFRLPIDARLIAAAALRVGLSESAQLILETMVPSLASKAEDRSRRRFRFSSTSNAAPFDPYLSHSLNAMVDLTPNSSSSSSAEWLLLQALEAQDDEDAGEGLGAAATPALQFSYFRRRGDWFAALLAMEASIEASSSNEFNSISNSDIIGAELTMSGRNGEVVTGLEELLGSMGARHTQSLLRGVSPAMANLGETLGSRALSHIQCWDPMTVSSGTLQTSVDASEGKDDVALSPAIVKMLSGGIAHAATILPSLLRQTVESLHVHVSTENSRAAILSRAAVLDFHNLERLLNLPTQSQIHLPIHEQSVMDMSEEESSPLPEPLRGILGFPPETSASVLTRFTRAFDVLRFSRRIGVISPIQALQGADSLLARITEKRIAHSVAPLLHQFWRETRMDATRTVLLAKNAMMNSTQQTPNTTSLNRTVACRGQPTLNPSVSRVAMRGSIISIISSLQMSELLWHQDLTHAAIDLCQDTLLALNNLEATLYSAIGNRTSPPVSSSFLASLRSRIQRSLGLWASQTASLPSATIVTELLRPAAASLSAADSDTPNLYNHDSTSKRISSVEPRCLAFTSLATFYARSFAHFSARLESHEADTRLHDREVEYTSSQAAYKNLPQNHPQFQTIAGNLRSLKKEIEFDRNERRELKKSQLTTLNEALDCLSKVILIAEDEVTDVVIQFVQLWLPNGLCEGVSKCVQNLISSPNFGSFQFVSLHYQLLTRLGLSASTEVKSIEAELATEFNNVLSRLVFRLCVDHPFHCLMQLLSLVHERHIDSTATNTSISPPPQSRKEIAASVAREVLAEIRPLMASIETLLLSYFSLALSPVDDLLSRASASGNRTREFPYRDLQQRGQCFNEVVGKLSPPPAIITRTLPLHKDANYGQIKSSDSTQNSSFAHSATQKVLRASGSSIVRIAKVKETFKVAPNGLSKPKILSIIGSDGQTYTQLVKGKDDVRQDAVLQQVFSLLNYHLARDAAATQRQLYLRTYRVIPITSECGVLEWVNQTIPFGDLLYGLHSRYNPEEWSTSQCRNHLLSAKSSSDNNVVATDIYEQKLLEIYENFHPLLRFFFLEKFSNPRDWLLARRLFTRSVATNSMAGFVLGIGDRHAMNILVDQRSGELVHIDFGIIFDQGKILNTPELVPFRLTRELVDGMGVTGVEGTFRRSCEEALRVLRENSSSLMTILDVVLHDPLSRWNLTPLQPTRQPTVVSRNTRNNSGGNYQVDAAKRTLQRIQAKLRGLDEHSTQVLSVEAHVDRLINEARDISNLSRIFPGWSPWL